MEEIDRKALDEIENEDYDLAELSDNTENKIKARDGDIFAVKKHSFPPSCIKSRAELDEMRAKSILSVKNKAKNRAAKKREIRTYAFNLKSFDIYSPISQDDFDTLINLLLLDRIEVIKTCENQINNRITKLLTSLIPIKLRECFKEYPQSFIHYPGFTYHASKEYGRGLVFKAKPEIPYYFEQGTEMDVLRKNKNKYLYWIDKKVIKYHENRESLLVDKKKYTTKLQRLKSKTYVGLLDLNPFWFDILYKFIINSKE